MAPEQQVTIDKLVHGGQGIGSLEDGRKALLWNVLPGETVTFEKRKSKSGYVEGLALEITNPSADREIPRDDLYLSTSPWQMMSYAAENTHKRSILVESLERGGVSNAPELDFIAPEQQWHYRNKMEYSFYGDDDGLHLALFNRGTHRKQIVTGSSIARPEIDQTAGAICQILHDAGIRAGDLKSVIVRCNQQGDTVAAIFTKNEKFVSPEALAGVCKGIIVCYSNPKSPASVLTKIIHRYGEITLTDRLLETDISYDVVSFFQVNLEPYQKALHLIAEAAKNFNVTDMYSGTGSIGLSVAQGATLVELDSASVEMARYNAQADNTIVHAASEKSLEYIPAGAGECVIFDPPRAGLHAKVTQTVLENAPEKVIYLSCNPSTMARDLAFLQEKYTITQMHGFNFFPQTPHIEALAVLELL